MHKLYEYVCDEHKDIEKKAERGDLSMQDIQYADTLAHLKKNLMKADEMMQEDGEYSLMYYPMTSYAEDHSRMRSYAPRRDAMGRYRSMAHDETIGELHDVMRDAKDEGVRSEIKRLIDRIEKM